MGSAWLIFPCVTWSMSGGRGSLASSPHTPSHASLCSPMDGGLVQLASGSSLARELPSLLAQECSQSSSMMSLPYVHYFRGQFCISEAWRGYSGVARTRKGGVWIFYLHIQHSQQAFQLSWFLPLPLLTQAVAAKCTLQLVLQFFSLGLTPVCWSELCWA